MKPTTQSANGTSFHSSTVNATVNQLRQILGEPLMEDNTGEDKVNFEWEMETEDGEIFTVYDWKEYRPISKDELIEWHIGAKHWTASNRAEQEIKTALSNLK